MSETETSSIPLSCLCRPQGVLTIVLFERNSEGRTCQSFPDALYIQGFLSGLPAILPARLTPSIVSPHLLLELSHKARL